MSKFFRRVISVERDVVVGRPEVLAERENVDVDFAKIPHYGNYFLDCLTHSKNHPSLRWNIWRDALCKAEDLHHARISPSRTRFLVESRDRFRVVIVNLGLRLQDSPDAVLISLEIGHEHLDGTSRNSRMNLPDCL